MPFLCILLAKTLAAQSDSTSRLPPGVTSKTSIIIVKNESFDSIMAELDREGYKIDRFVKNVIIETKFKRPQGSIKNISLHIRYRNGVAQIMGTYFKLDSSNGRVDPVIRPDPLFPKPFEAMYNFAVALKGEISFEE